MDNKELAERLRAAAVRADIEMNDGDGAYVVARISTVIDTLEKADEGVEELQAILAAAEDELIRYREGYKGSCYACETVGEKNVELETKLAAAEVYMEAMTHALHGISLCSQNSMSDKRECGTIARQTIAAIDAAIQKEES